MHIKHGADKDNRVSLSIFVPSLGGEIEYQTVCGKFLPIVTRCKTKEGERLILAIRVHIDRGRGQNLLAHASPSTAFGTTPVSVGTTRISP